MKAIIISHVALETIRDKLITDLTAAMDQRETDIVNGLVAPTTAHKAVNYHVHTAFESLRDA